MAINTRRDIVFLSLAGFFITNALLAEVTGGKLIHVGPFLATAGFIMWPVVFITTDLINEYYGRAGVKRLTYITIAMILFAFAMIFAMMQIPAADVSPVKDDAFNSVFGQSLWIIFGSIIAFLISQIIDVSIFWFLREKTGETKLWLRSTGSTVISQLIDTFVIMGIAFWLPGKLSFHDYISLSLTNYSYKVVIAILATPVIYLAHAAIDKYLGKLEAHSLVEKAAHDSIQK